MVELRPIIICKRLASQHRQELVFLKLEILSKSRLANIGQGEDMNTSIIRAGLLMLTLSINEIASAKYCDSLFDVVSSDDVRATLIDWVDSNINSNGYSYEDVTGGGGRVPGRYFIDIPFDKSILKYKGRLQVRLVGTRPYKIQSVNFSERSRYGIIVRLKNAADFGVYNDQYLTVVSDRVAVFCMDLSYW